MDQEMIKELYEWQEPITGNDSRFQIIHLLIAAILGFFIGGYLSQPMGI